ncbi:hypothetical protein [Kerstersia gyiorum]|uniref:hypothetical protein n=1 Tax=Kerstersia gyiorum TaxID=206506 RepID=UPI00129000C7|nr:hypothetical protein [Kerstersia gyiorum]
MSHRDVLIELRWCASLPQRGQLRSSLSQAAGAATQKSCDYQKFLQNKTTLFSRANITPILLANLPVTKDCNATLKSDAEKVGFPYL